MIVSRNGRLFAIWSALGFVYCGGWQGDVLTVFVIESVVFSKFIYEYACFPQKEAL